MLKAAKTVATKHADTASVSDASHGPFSVEDYRNVLAEAKDYIRFINASDYSVVVSHIDLILSSPPIFLPSSPPPSQHLRGSEASELAEINAALKTINDTCLKLRYDDRGRYGAETIGPLRDVAKLINKLVFLSNDAGQLEQVERLVEAYVGGEYEAQGCAAEHILADIRELRAALTMEGQP